jgi:protein-tyrosine-phosphatase
MAKSAGFGDIVSDSAGTAAMSHYRIFGDLKEVIEENGLSVHGHIPEMISRESLGEFDLIIVMTEFHRRDINERFPGYEDKVFLLSEYAGEGQKDVTDPIGRGIEVYRQTFKEIKEYMNKLIEEVKDEFEKD